MRPALRSQVLCLPDMSWEVPRERFIRLEALGIEVGAPADHFVDWTNPPSPRFKSRTALTGLAASPRPCQVHGRRLRGAITPARAPFTMRPLARDSRKRS
jgi:hypothetical protein